MCWSEFIHESLSEAADKAAKIKTTFKQQVVDYGEGVGYDERKKEVDLQVFSVTSDWNYLDRSC